MGEPGMAAVILCFLGLGALLSFAQTAKVATVGVTARMCGVLLLPAAIALLWRLGQAFGWWSAAIFVMIALGVGTWNGVTARRVGAHVLFASQSWLGPVFVCASVACWLF